MKYQEKEQEIKKLQNENRETLTIKISSKTQERLLSAISTVPASAAAIP